MRQVYVDDDFSLALGLAVPALDERIRAAEERYGPFASTHEALGVAVEEWDELRAAIHANDLAAVQHECMDLAAVLIRLAQDLRDEEDTRAALKHRQETCAT